MHPLLEPIYRRYLWGGRGFATTLGRDLPPGEDFAESWELVDRPGSDQSVVSAGPLAGRTLGELVRDRGRELLGRHAPLPAFPLLFKFLDARRDLSVQVHPDDARAARLVPPDRGKTEAWYVIDAAPGSRIYAGLAPGVGRAELAAAIERGTCADVLHSFVARAGDCVFIPAGTVHAIGAGLLVAEIQQSSDVTYRLFDWNRVGPDGRPRPLHVEAGVEAVTRFGPVAPVQPVATFDAAVRRLVTGEFFVFDEVLPTGPWEIGGDDACHVIVVLEGTLRLEDRWSLPAAARGRTLLLPAAIGRQRVDAGTGATTKLLHIALPDRHFSDGKPALAAAPGDP
ncbi:MAG: class I mannose-6-phosphate isomerase [Planctomycetia bacterium]|nr:class I mannose-6-phosphate isomerase [Planctomycetia bacterium]